MTAGRPEDIPADQAEVEAWRDLQAVLEERDREWWAEEANDDQPQS